MTREELGAAVLALDLAAAALRGQQAALAALADARSADVAGHAFTASATAALRFLDAYDAEKKFLEKALAAVGG